MRRIGFYLPHNNRLSACAAACTAKRLSAPARRDPHPNRRCPGRRAPPRWPGVSYLEWEQVDFSSAEAFTQAIGTMLDNIQSIGATVVLAQVRPPSAMRSTPATTSRSATSAPARRGRDWFDPLALLVDAAHARDLQLEAWVNPYRIQAGQTPALCGASPARLHPDWVRVHRHRRVSRPPPARTCGSTLPTGWGRLCARYAVDGIHFDDYFYPHHRPGL